MADRKQLFQVLLEKAQEHEREASRLRNALDVIKEMQAEVPEGSADGKPPTFPAPPEDTRGPSDKSPGGAGSVRKPGDSRARMTYTRGVLLEALQEAGTSDATALIEPMSRLGWGGHLKNRADSVRTALRSAERSFLVERAGREWWLTPKGVEALTERWPRRTGAQGHEIVTDPHDEGTTERTATDEDDA